MKYKFCTKITFSALFLFLLFNSLLLDSHAKASVDPIFFIKHKVCFSPGKCCLKNIKLLINNARYSIKIAVDYLADEKILEYLNDAIKRGVDVKFITDSEKFQSSGSLVYALEGFGADIAMPSANFEANRFALFDDVVVFTGSYDWVESSTTIFSNNCIVLTEERYVKRYLKRFNFLWKLYKGKI